MHRVHSPLICYGMAEGCYLVRGTLDIQQAKDALADWLEGKPEPDGYGLLFSRDDALGTVASLFAISGWHRFNPCHCGEGHDWDLGDGKEGQRGSFRAVGFYQQW